MVRTSHRGGIGAVGSAFARYFHPSQHVRDAHPNEWKTKRFSDVTIVRDGIETVRHKQQRCYFCNIPGINQILYIVTANFKVEQPPAIVFEAERRPTDAPGEITKANNSIDNRRSLQNVEQNVASGRSTNEDIIELRRLGIQVDDDNKPAPENVWAPPQQSTTVGEFFTPTICPRRATGTMMDEQGKWNSCSWDAIGKMSEFDLFRMAFPEAYIIDVIIPATNDKLTNHMTLQEFYCWLGCNFIMCCFEGVANREEWWSTKAISIDEGAPFRLTPYMAKGRFLQLTGAMTYTNNQHLILKTNFLMCVKLSMHSTCTTNPITLQHGSTASMSQGALG